jgi:hypothetical protein
MRNLDRLIERAQDHVEKGRQILARHRKRIAEGNAAPGALDMLGQFERSQEIFEADLTRLMKERDRQNDPHRP